MMHHYTVNIIQYNTITLTAAIHSVCSKYIVLIVCILLKAALINIFIVTTTIKRPVCNVKRIAHYNPENYPLTLQLSNTVELRVGFQAQLYFYRARF